MLVKSAVTVEIPMEQCADFLARMIQKYGPEILAELKEKDAKESGE